MQRAVQKGHVAVGRDDVGEVRLDRHPVLDLEDLHAGVAPDEVGEDALVVRGQMLHQHKGHTRIGVFGHAGKEGFKGCQPPGGGANAHDGEIGIGRQYFLIYHRFGTGYNFIFWIAFLFRHFAPLEGPELGLQLDLIRTSFFVEGV